MRTPYLISRELLIMCALACFFTGIAAGTRGKSTENKKARPKDGLPYLTLSAGAAIWYVSNQNGLSNRSIPLSLGVEYGRTSSPLSFIAGAFFNTAFQYDIFLLKPDNFLTGVQYAPLKNKKISKKFNIYCIAGLNASYSRFTDDHYSGIVNYDYKTERKAGIGLSAGAGVGYRLKSWEIKPVLFYFTGHSNFLAGHFAPQKFNTGSLQLHLMLSHRFIFNENNRTCPVYHKYHRI